MIVAFTEQAETDLEAIGDYIARDNPERAVSFVEEIVERCERLGERPYAFALVPRYAHAGVRHRSFGNYLIFYRASDDRVEILHILNAAQDYERILFPQD